MFNDPIIQEVRKAREEIARKNNYDFDMICKQAIEYQNQFSKRLVSDPFEKKNETSDVYTEAKAVG
jgi:hypothetical protein